MDIFKRVAENYQKNFAKLEDKRFHFASRLFLWTGDEFAYRQLKKLKAEYIGTTEQDYAEKIKSLLEEDCPNENILFKKEREKFLLRYPLLQKYNKVLFRSLFCETVYGLDIRKIIEQQVKKEELVELRRSLWRDREAVAALSTQAVNYFYGLSHYLREESNPIEPDYFMEVVESEAIIDSKNKAALQVYLLTHCIIGESVFYARCVEKNIKAYGQMFSKVEEIIAAEYENVSLDSKVEFLVCAKLCQKKSYLEERIFADTEKAFDSRRNYFAEGGKIKDGSTFRKGEHRNVLALMAFQLKRKPKSSRK